MDTKLAKSSENQSFSPEFKLLAVERLRQCDNAAALARELGVRRNQLYKWAKRVDLVGPDLAFRPPGRPPADDEDELTRLRRENHRLALEVEILKKAEAYFMRR
jgi:transposase